MAKKTYTLEVLTNPTTGSQYNSYTGIDERTVYADEMFREDGAYLFFTNDQISAAYPIERTIIKLIK